MDYNLAEEAAILQLSRWFFLSYELFIILIQYYRKSFSSHINNCYSHLISIFP